MAQNPSLFHAAQVVISIDNNFTESVNFTGFVTPKQIDIIIENAKEKTRDWFKRIEDLVKEENPNIEFLMKVIILTGLAVYGEIICLTRKV